MAKIAKSKLDRAVKVLLMHGASEVYLFGSQISGRAHSGSDVDLAVKGLPPKRFFRAMGEAIEAVGRPLDLVDLDQDNSFTRYLLSQGELVRVF